MKDERWKMKNLGKSAPKFWTEYANVIPECSVWLASSRLCVGETASISHENVLCSEWIGVGRRMTIMCCKRPSETEPRCATRRRRNAPTCRARQRATWVIQDVLHRTYNSLMVTFSCSWSLLAWVIYPQKAITLMLYIGHTNNDGCASRIALRRSCLECLTLYIPLLL